MNLFEEHHIILIAPFLHKDASQLLKMPTAAVPLPRRAKRNYNPAVALLFTL